jgi:hypothetical protein
VREKRGGSRVSVPQDEEIARSQTSKELWNAGLRVDVCETDDDTGEEAMGVLPMQCVGTGKGYSRPGQIPGPCFPDAFHLDGKWQSILAHPRANRMASRCRQIAISIWLQRASQNTTPSRVNMPGTTTRHTVRLLPSRDSGVWAPVIEVSMDKLPLFL